MNPTKLARQLNEGATAHQRGDLATAERAYRDVLKHAPKQPDALHLLGVLMDQRGERIQGMMLVRQALAAQSSFPDAHVNLARMLAASGDLPGAKSHFDRALVLKPTHAHALNGLGTLFRAQRDYAKAIDAFGRAARLDPCFTDAHVNLCNTYRDADDASGLLAAASQGVAVDPAAAPLWLLRSEASFTTGDLAAGWKDYEWRFKTPQNPVERQPYTLPTWGGEKLAGKSILVWHEQAPGEEILFANMLPSVITRAARVVVQTTPRLAPLLRRSFPKAEIFDGPVPAAVAGSLDLQSALGSVGQHLRTSFRDFPNAAPHLAANAARTAALRAKYKQPGKLLVGISWKSAHAKVQDAAQKTVGLNQWGALLSVPGVVFVNLQYGDTAAEFAAARREFGADIIEDAEIDPIRDLDGFAAQAAAMDLVISSSNTAAHVAGAVGVPTFCMVPRALGNGRRWYWFGEGRFSPWYRSVTLFRQRSTEIWSDVIANVALALVAAAQGTGALPDPAAYLESLARGYTSAGLPGEAAMIYGAAARTATGDKAAHLFTQQGMTLARAGRFEDAAAAYQSSIALAPNEAETYNNLGNTLRRLGRAAETSAAYAAAHRLKPDHPSIFLNHAMALSEVGKLEDSLAALDSLVALKPDYVDAQYNRAMVLMGLGRLKEGWEAFQWRMKRPGVHVHHDHFPQKVWTGEDLGGKHVLVWTDLGLGEEILLAGLIPDLAAVARKVTLLCSERLLGLFRCAFPHVTVALRADPLPAAALAPDIDFQMSVAELGLAFRRDFQAFPLRPHYLTADTALRDKLRKRYRQGANQLVGISWRSINPEIGAQKSIPLATWLPLLKTPGMTFVNLQYGDSRAEVEDLRRAHGITLVNDPDIDSLGDMERVAAQVAAMDHVVSISTTTVHLAGALGVPVSVLLPPGHARLWYWFRGLEACAWYPSVRLLAADADADQTVTAARVGLSAPGRL